VQGDFTKELSQREEHRVIIAVKVFIMPEEITPAKERREKGRGVTNIECVIMMMMMVVVVVVAVFR